MKSWSSTGIALCLFGGISPISVDAFMTSLAGSSSNLQLRTRATCTSSLSMSRKDNDNGNENRNNNSNGNNHNHGNNNNHGNNKNMEDYEAARQSFERMVHINGNTGDIHVAGGFPSRAHLTANEGRIRETEIQLLETLRESDAAIDPLVELWVNERQDGAEAIHRMIHVRSPGLLEEEYTLRAMINDYGPDGWMEPHGRLALLLFTRGEYWEAADLCEFVLDVKPWHFEVAQLLVITQLRLGDFERALQMTRKYVLPPLQHPKRRTKWITNMLATARQRLEQAKQMSEHSINNRWLEESPDSLGDADCWQ